MKIGQSKVKWRGKNAYGAYLPWFLRIVSKKIDDREDIYYPHSVVLMIDVMDIDRSSIIEYNVWKLEILMFQNIFSSNIESKKIAASNY